MSWKVRTPIPMDKAFFDRQTVPEGSHASIQWKGTEVCMDIHCSCGELGHVDAEFAYFVQCPKCGTKYICNRYINLIPIDPSEDSGDEALMVIADPDDEE